VFRALRDELDVDVQRQPKTLPYVPSEDEIRRYYQAVWQARRGDMVLIKPCSTPACASPNSGSCAGSVGMIR